MVKAIMASSLTALAMLSVYSSAVAAAAAFAAPANDDGTARAYTH